jgi:hypothetical protein
VLADREAGQDGDDQADPCERRIASTEGSGELGLGRTIELRPQYRADDEE